MATHYDLGAALVILSLIVIPAGLLKLPELRVRNAAAISVLAFLVGFASLFGRRS